MRGEFCLQSTCKHKHARGHTHTHTSKSTCERARTRSLQLSWKGRRIVQSVATGDAEWEAARPCPGLGQGQACRERAPGDGVPWTRLSGLGVGPHRRCSRQPPGRWTGFLRRQARAAATEAGSSLRASRAPGDVQRGGAGPGGRLPTSSDQERTPGARVRCRQELERVSTCMYIPGGWALPARPPPPPPLPPPRGRARALGARPGTDGATGRPAAPATRAAGVAGADCEAGLGFRLPASGLRDHRRPRWAERRFRWARLPGSGDHRVRRWAGRRFRWARLPASGTTDFRGGRGDASGALDFLPAARVHAWPELGGLGGGCRAGKKAQSWPEAQSCSLGAGCAPLRPPRSPSRPRSWAPTGPRTRDAPRRPEQDPGPVPTCS